MINPIESDDERLNLKFHNEDVAITGMAALRDNADPSKIVLALGTALGEAHLEMTLAFAKQLAAAIGKACGDRTVPEQADTV